MDRINKGTINVSNRTHLKEESLSSGAKQRISEITSEPIFNEEKKTTAIPQDKTLIERKIEQLKTQGRNYIVRQDNKSAAVPDVFMTLLTAMTTRFRFYPGYPKAGAQTDVKQCGNQKTIGATSFMQQGSQETSGIADKSADISNTSIQSSTNTLSEDTPGILQYLSKGDLIDFNCKAKNLYDRKPIECRHLAYAFATDEFGTKETGKLSFIAGVKKIACHKRIKIDQELNDSFSHKTAQEGITLTGKA